MLVLHYFLRFDLSIIYFVIIMAMAFLFIGNFKGAQTRQKTLSILLGLGLAELVMFFVIKFLAHKLMDTLEGPLPHRRGTSAFKAAGQPAACPSLRESCWIPGPPLPDRQLCAPRRHRYGGI